jgi:hypothetical protein
MDQNHSLAQPENELMIMLYDFYFFNISHILVKHEKEVNFCSAVQKFKILEQNKL